MNLIFQIQLNQILIVYLLFKQFISKIVIPKFCTSFSAVFFFRHETFNFEFYNSLPLTILSLKCGHNYSSVTNWGEVFNWTILVPFSLFFPYKFAFLYQCGPSLFSFTFNFGLGWPSIVWTCSLVVTADYWLFAVARWHSDRPNSFSSPETWRPTQGRLVGGLWLRDRVLTSRSTASIVRWELPHISRSRAERL